MTNSPSSGRLPFYLYAITDRHVLPRGGSLVTATEQAVEQASPSSLAVLLRDKDLAFQERLELAQRLRAVTLRRGVYFLVHGDLDLAMRCGADGVHMPDDGRDLRSIRHEAPGLLLGVSCHDNEGLQRAAAEGASFATLSPVRPSLGKAAPGEELGWDRFEQMSSKCPIPVFALGGLGPDDGPTARQRGAWGIAAISSIFAAAEPGQVIAALTSSLRSTEATR
ncbi:MAG TPA: hypothetical protein DIU15_08630 [Deltaproteobacteria bacterium]|nr:hypothetical protein [Deltaproteobacteria bacterium]HCP46092.1 hypothetical protein [Deltaproteobacteria bacterium]